MAAVRTLACVTMLLRGNLDGYMNGTNVCNKIGHVSTRYCPADEAVVPPGLQKISDLIDERLSTGFRKILQITNRADAEVDLLQAGLEKLLEKLPSKESQTTIISAPQVPTTPPGTIEPATVAVSKETPTPGPTTSTSATTKVTTTEQVTTTEPVTTTKHVTTAASKGPPRNCDMVCDDVISGNTSNEPVGFAISGTSYRIFPKFSPDEGVLVYCECDNDSDGAWTVFQRRLDGSVSFYRNWANYTRGFGSASGDFWLGLDALANFTSDGGYVLRVDLEDWRGDKGHAEYRDFSVSNKTTNYTLTVGSYSGNVGDSLRNHNGRKFSTYDVQNEDGGPFGNCASHFYGAWWFYSCYESHLNGFHFRKNQEVTYPPYGISWNSWRRLHDSLKATEMKFRPMV